jgi:hypothetical protein
MLYDWDDNKNLANKAKHKISFETAILIFDDPDHISQIDQNFSDEERWQTIGLINNIHCLLVIHTYRSRKGDEVNRIISARKATKKERQYYEKANR